MDHSYFHLIEQWKHIHGCLETMVYDFAKLDVAVKLWHNLMWKLSSWKRIWHVLKNKLFITSNIWLYWILLRHLAHFKLVGFGWGEQVRGPFGTKWHPTVIHHISGLGHHAELPNEMQRRPLPNQVSAAKIILRVYPRRMALWTDVSNWNWQDVYCVQQGANLLTEELEARRHESQVYAFR